MAQGHHKQRYIVHRNFPALEIHYEHLGCTVEHTMATSEQRHTNRWDVHSNEAAQHELLTFCSKMYLLLAHS